MTKISTFLATSVVVGAFSATLDAKAFCRTTTCDPLKQSCAMDQGCNASGMPISWLSACVEFSVQMDGSPKFGITAEAARSIITDSFATWMAAPCAGGFPAISISPDQAFVATNQLSFSIDGGNKNVWMFRDAAWPYENAGHTLALSTVTMDLTHGRILDVDVEVNSADYQITTESDAIAIDFASIATHEAGHFLGLDHSQMRSATMFANYTGGNADLRELDADDIAGICTIYPPDRPSLICETDALVARASVNRSEPESGCGCRTASRGTRARSFWSAGLLLAAASGALRRRTRV